MNQTQVRTILLLIVLICHTPLFAQRNFERHEFSFHVGYGNMFKGTPSLTLSTHSYQRELAQGVSWDGQYYFRPLKRFIFGAVYTGFSSKGSHSEGSDHLLIHFIGAQIGMCNANTKHWQVRMTAGPGGMFFRNNSQVFGKTRKVTAGNIGLLINSNVNYKLTPNLGIGIGVQYLATGLFRMKSHYHGETVTVKFDENQDANLSRLNISGGLSYYF
ncbi:hypothetical protein [Bacteroides faecium]|uniref:Outer membrane protein beta-barrel domain-containing protein n=1 Tax=Bacteroides faecium TaxID=2715212 RepID=A0A6H0KJW9_9BACE|nr:hypothetical protein [Bacteroides faecium]QIU93321.1 hypothetical protein BacF7301_03780 [Bacteroides faecium]